MKKNILSIVICFCLFFSIMCRPAVAETTLMNVTYDLDYEKGEVTLSFEDAIPNTRATVLVMNPGFTLSSALDDGAIQYQREVIADEDGLVNVSFLLNGDINPQNSVNYPVYVKIPGRATENILSITIVGVNKRIEAINALKADKETISALLADQEMRLCLGIEYFKPYTEINNGLFVDRLVGKFSSFEADVESFPSVRAYLKQFCVLELFNQNMPSKVYSDSGEYYWEEVMGFDALDKKNETTLYKCYSEIIKDDAKKKIRESLFGKDFETPQEFFKNFSVNTVLYGIPAPKVTGYYHIGELLTAKNRKMIELEISRSLNADEEALLAAYQGTFDNITSLKNYIEGLLSDDGDSDFGNNPGGSIGGGSSSSGPKGPGEFSADHYPAQNTENAQKNVFEDISDDHWAVKPIAYLKAKGVVNGVNGDNFAPNAAVTREQFIKMLFAILDIEPDEASVSRFGDVVDGMWYTPYINAAVKKGIINGISDTDFGVGRFASRQDLCTMLYRAIEIKASAYKEFSDEDSIADYAYDAVGVLSSKGIVNGYPDGSFKPLAKCTRAEAATLIYNVAMIMEVK